MDESPSKPSIATTSYFSSMSTERSQQILMTATSLQLIADLIESIFRNATAAAAAAAAAAAMDSDQYAKLNEKISSLVSVDYHMRQALDDIRSIACEMSCNVSAVNVDATTTALLRRLENYSWNAKVVLAMAAFASSIGELSMVVKHRNTDPVAKSVEILKGHSPALDFTVLESLFRAIMEVVKTNLAFLNPNISKIPKESPSMVDAMPYFPIATNKILRIVIQVVSILNKPQVNIDLIRQLAAEVGDINTILQQKLLVCQREAGDAAKAKPYQYEDFPKPIAKLRISEAIDKIWSYMKSEVPENMRNRHVLLLISDLDISIEEIKVLNWLYQKNDQMYAIVWLPIVNLSTYDTERFKELKQLMKWSVVEPSRIELDVVEFIKKEWSFIKKTIAVSVNPGGEVTCQNALPMLWTWGNLAFPFTDKTEQELWNKIDEQNGWSLDLLLNEHIVPEIRSWIESRSTFVCLFGGGDMSWIQEFTEKVKYAAYAAGVSLKLVYVGKNKGKGLARNELSREIKVIESEFQWQFWTRLESILYAKIRHGKTVTTYKTDRVMQEALKVVGYGGSDEAWAMFSMGPGAMVTTNGEMALTIMSNYQNWRQDTTGLRFLEGIKSYKDAISLNVHGCINVHLPVLGQIPGTMICPECSKTMEMFYTYRCCAE
ncbi:protein SIEVE ELEMENT OCCLUSION A-like [Durio zibethinus]|uniref:Protein SIEVE ELEMENT OCCLUSION A-like n=1 Tax=Durio zibethinus TaxID=66656 RepID=A0A6P5YSU7_DURZI|nr:protein SIEVE ELEMENT OCCLUSION A-like [Durio zibethinus]